MAKQFYRLSITVTGDKLSTLVDLMTKEGADLHIEPLDGKITNTMPLARVKGATRAHGKSPMTDALHAWISDMPQGKEFTTADIKKFLEKAGFKPTNSGPLMSKIMADTTIAVMSGRGQYKATGRKA